MDHLKTITFTILSLASYCIAGTNRLPDFSWDTVPRYMHVRKATAFTSEEIKYLATFPLLTFEKTTGAKEFGCTEAGTLRAAKAVKGVNPQTKILYYRNILVHYGSYDADEELEDISSPFLVDKQGNVNLVRGTLSAYDLSNKDVASWWLDHVKKMSRSKYIDGIFVDGNIKALEHGYLLRQVGEEKRCDVEDAYHRMMKKLRRDAGSKKLVLANIIRARFADAGLEYMKYFDGSYIEGFEHAVGKMSREDYMAKGIDAIQTAARSGKIIAFTIGMGDYGDTDMDLEKGTDSSRKFETLQDRLTYTLALFLICAEKYSYFMLADGYGVDNGKNKLWMKDIPEYTYPLGAPKGPAVKDGFVYRREFAHASVWLDLAQEKAQIEWK